MNVVDSSGWLEYFAAGPNACYFASPIEDTKNLIVPVLCLKESNILPGRNKERSKQEELSEEYFQWLLW